MKRFFVSLIVGLVPVAAIMFLYWIGGREFVRSESLKTACLSSMLLFIGTFVMVFFNPKWTD